VGVLKTGFGAPVWLPVAAGLAAWGLAGAIPAPREALEHEVKATFVVNFGRYVEWTPGTPQADPRKPVRIGVLGQDPFGQALDAAAQGAAIQGRPVVVERFDDAAKAAACNIVFIGASEARRAAEIVPLLNRGGALTVSDSAAVARHGAEITLVKEQNRIRFAINLAEARRAGLKIGSQLLRLASSVESGP
jgi:hypothetical protein